MPRLAVSLPGVYSRLSGKIGLPPAALHLLIWLGVAAVSSLILFTPIYGFISNMLLDPVQQQSNGAYPLAMLLFLILWLAINSDSIRERLKMDIDGFNRFPTALGMAFGVGAVVLFLNIGRITTAWGGEWTVLLDLLVLMVWFEGLALIFANATGMFALRYLALFVPTASLQYILSAFFDPQVSFGFLSIYFPLLAALGYPVILNTANPTFQTIFVNRPDGAVTLWINAGCTGLPAISVFFLLAGLIYLDAKPKMKYFIPSVILGFVATLLLNMVRLTILVDAAVSGATLAAANEAVYSTHEWIGYVIYSIFYVAYVFIMLLPRFRREQDSSNDVSPSADA